MADDRPELGAGIIALHDPHRGHEHDFNRWYEADHMLGAGTMAPWTIAGARWVAPRALRDLRYPADGPFGPSDRGAYLMLFWIQAGRLADQQAWVFDEMQKIAEQDRNFAQRDAVTATTYDFVRSVERDVDGVPVVLALLRHYPGVVLVAVERAADTSLDALGDWLMDDYFAARMAGTPLAMAVAFTPRPKEPWWPASSSSLPRPAKCSSHTSTGSVSVKQTTNSRSPTPSTSGAAAGHHGSFGRGVNATAIASGVPAMRAAK